jgi:hypothetical protein
MSSDIQTCFPETTDTTVEADLKQKLGSIVTEKALVAAEDPLKMALSFVTSIQNQLGLDKLKEEKPGSLTFIVGKAYGFDEFQILRLLLEIFEYQIPQPHQLLWYVNLFLLFTL